MWVEASSRGSGKSPVLEQGVKYTDHPTFRISDLLILSTGQTHLESRRQEWAGGGREGTAHKRVTLLGQRQEENGSQHAKGQ